MSSIDGVRASLEAGLDLNYLRSRPIVPRPWQELEITLVGCGGTGSWLAPSLARLAAVCRQAGRKVDLVFVDPDLVEAANVPRQNFCQAEVGVNKASALALRYGAAWGVQIPVVSSRFDGEQFGRMPVHQQEMQVIVGCVDNAAARRAIEEAVRAQNGPSVETGRPPSTWWLDCGNAAESGQVLLGSTKDRAYLRHAFEPETICRALPLPSVQRPELLEDAPEELPDADLSCAELAARNAQSLMVNQNIAAVAADYLLRLVMVGDLRKFATYIDLPSGAARTYYTTPEVVAEAMREPAEFFTKKVETKK
jgi:PRTRC genetic system ThiF family protein